MLAALVRVFVLLSTDVASPLAQPPDSTMSPRAPIVLEGPALVAPNPVFGSAEKTAGAYFVSPVQGNPRGIADDGAFLYLTNWNPPITHRNRVYKIDRSTGQLVATINHGLGYLAGLAYDCSDGTFWAGDYNQPGGQTIYHLDSSWQLLEQFDTPEVDNSNGGIDGLTLVGDEIWVGGDITSTVQRYARDGTYLGDAVNYGIYRRSGLAYDGTHLWGVLIDWGFVSKFPPQGPPWVGFYSGYYWNYKDLVSSNPASGFFEDLEFACGDPTRLWAYGIRFDTGQSVVLRYDVSSGGVRAGSSDCDVWTQHYFGQHSCASSPLAATWPATPAAAAGPLRGQSPKAVPSPGTSSVDACLLACPAGDLVFHVTVRDASANPIPGSFVTLSFADCVSFSVCNAPAAYSVNLGARIIGMTTGPTGVASFPLRVAANCPGASVHIAADGLSLGDRTFASIDQNGDLAVNALDLAVLFSRQAGDRAGDLDCDGVTSCPVTGVATAPQPTRFALAKLWPNPIASTGNAVLNVEMPFPGEIVVDLYDAVGRRLSHQTISGLVIGRHQIHWRAPDRIRSGVYRISISDGHGNRSSRALVILGS
jgi:hypothetical protein